MTGSHDTPPLHAGNGDNPAFDFAPLPTDINA